MNTTVAASHRDVFDPIVSGIRERGYVYDIRAGAHCRFADLEDRFGCRVFVSESALTYNIRHNLMLICGVVAIVILDVFKGGTGLFHVCGDREQGGEVEVKLLEKFDFYDTVVSIKSSTVQTTNAANRMFA